MVRDIDRDVFFNSTDAWLVDNALITSPKESLVDLAVVVDDAHDWLWFAFLRPQRQVIVAYVPSSYLIVIDLS